MSQETVAAQDMISRFGEWQGRDPASVAADATYGNGDFLRWLMEQGITPYIRTRDSALRKNSPLYGPERFTYLPESNSCLGPAGQQLNYGGHNARNRTHVHINDKITHGNHPRSVRVARIFQCLAVPRQPLKLLKTLEIRVLKRLASAVQLRPWPPHFQSLSANPNASQTRSKLTNALVRREGQDSQRYLESPNTEARSPAMAAHKTP